MTAALRALVNLRPDPRRSVVSMHMELVDFLRLLLRRLRRTRLRQRAARQLSGDLEGMHARRPTGAEPPHTAGDQHHQHQDGDHREVYFLIKPAHV